MAKLSCLFGIHKWDNCKCACGATRDIEHIWNGCMCSKCSKKRDEGHNLVNCKCQLCERIIHSWEGCKCSVCGEKRDSNHLYEGCICSICGKEKHKNFSLPCSSCYPSKKEELKKYVEDLKNSSNNLGCSICDLKKESLGHFACEICGKPLDLTLISSYIWKLSLVGGYMTAFSNTFIKGMLQKSPSGGAIIEFFKECNQILKLRLRTLMLHSILSVQRIAEKQATNDFLKQITNICLSIANQDTDKVEHIKFSKYANKYLNTFFEKGWLRRNSASNEHIANFILNTFGDSIVLTIGGQDTKNFLNEQKNLNLSPEELSSIEKVQKKIDIFDNWEIDTIASIMIKEAFPFCIPKF